jgi:hypothetical protein
LEIILDLFGSLLNVLKKSPPAGDAARGVG